MYSKKKNFALMWGAASAAIMQPLPQPVFAQGLEEVVITARRSEESVQTVPISVSAISGDVIADSKIDSGASLQTIVPSLSVYSLSRDQESFSLRGLSSANSSAQGQAPSVMVYFAQVPLPAGDGGGPGRYFDLQNVQVLKGPQGTLFGRNSTGGAVLFEPQRPSQQLEGYGQIQLGNYSDREFEGAVNTPLIDDLLAVRVSLKRALRDGFTENITNGEDLDDRDYMGGRVSLLITPDDRFENLLAMDYLRSDTNGSSNAVLGFNAGYTLQQSSPLGTPIILGSPVTAAQLGGAMRSNPASVPALRAQALAAGGAGLFSIDRLNSVAAQQESIGPRKVALSVDTRNKVSAWGFADTLTFDITDELTLKNILGYRAYKQYLRSDKDGSPLVLLDGVTDSGPTVNIEQWSNELQLQGSSYDRTLDWTVGVFGLTARAPEAQHDDHIYYGSTSATQETKPRETSRSIYAQATYDFSEAVDGLKFTAGYRFTKDHRELWQTATTGTACSLLPGEGVDITKCTLQLERDFSSSSYTLGIDYQVTPDTLMYVTHRRGYRAGGINTQGVAVGRGDYDPEYVTDYELGVKADWHISGDVSARTNVALFHTKRDDAQVSQPYAITLGGQPRLINMIVNEANATIKGLEFDGRLAFVQGVDLSLSWAYTEAAYDSYYDLRTEQMLRNMPYAFTPRNKLSVGARYSLPVPESIGDMSLSVNWSRSSSINFNVTPDPYGKQESYAQTNLYMNWRGMLGSSFDTSLFVTNLADKVYRIGGYPVYDAAGFSTGIYSEPRMWGATVKYSFGN